MTTWYPQLWCRITLRPESLRNEPPAPTPTIPSIDSVAASQFLPHTMTLIPQSATVNLRSYREADDATVRLQWDRLPISPQQIRAGSIEIYAGNFVWTHDEIAGTNDSTLTVTVVGYRDKVLASR